MTKSERQENEAIVRHGCAVCRQHFGVYSEPEIHHVRRMGTSKKREKSPKIGLCFRHHRGPYGVGIHSGREEWESRYGSEIDMAEEVMAALEGRTK